MAKAKAVTNLNSATSIEENIAKVIQVRLAEMYDWDAYVDHAYNIEELHNLRIAAKRLRYTLELFSEALPETCQLLVQEVVKIQEKLGDLHDSDVVIALLRLCLGGQASGPAYDRALQQVAKQRKVGPTLVNPALVAYLLDPDYKPSGEQRQGLEALLERVQQQRKEIYQQFRAHWYELKGRDFRRELLSVIE